MTNDAQRRAVLGAALEKLRMLSSNERASLCEVAKGLTARAIPRARQDTIIAADLGRQALGGFMLTDLGRAAASIARHAVDDLKISTR
jgi:hypothetical protein